MQKKKLTKQDIMASDAVYIIFTVVIAFCFISCAVVSAFLIVASMVQIVKAFQMPDIAAKIICVALLMLLSSALFIYLDIRIFKTIKTSLTDYLKERKDILKDLETEETANSQE